MAPLPIVWTIAGTDPAGGAGIQADLKTIHALGGYAATVITAVIAQNTMGVRAVEFPSEAILRAQLAALAEDLPPAAVKLGMLGRAATVRAVAETLAPIAAPVVCDPVLASTGGVALLDDEGRAVLIAELLPRIDVLTPNVPEAELLAGMHIRAPDDVPRAAARLRAMGARAVVLKGGHLDGGRARDYFDDGSEAFWMTSPRLDVTHTHGTGCVFSAALATGLALGKSAADAALLAKAYVNQGLRLGGGVGRGRGPLAHPGPPLDPRDRPERG